MIELLSKIALYINEKNNASLTERELGKCICDYYTEYIYSTINNRVTCNLSNPRLKSWGCINR